MTRSRSRRSAVDDLLECGLDRLSFGLRRRSLHRNEFEPRPNSHSGMLPCLRCGIVSRLLRSMSRAWISRLTRFLRLDHGIDVSTLGGDVGVRELLVVLAQQLGAASVGILGGCDLLAMDDVDRTLGRPSPRSHADGHANETSARMCFEFMTT